MRLVVAMVVLALGACVSANAVQCSDGRICPSGTVCAMTTVEGPLCVLQTQLDECVGKAEDDSCNTSARCYDGVCLPAFCGNGHVDAAEGEVCDDGNNMTGDGCSADCLSTEVCGNNQIDVVDHEQCDDDNRFSNDGCSSVCSDESPDWTHATSVDSNGAAVAPNLTKHGLAYDAARDRLVMFQASTYEWDGYAWRLPDLLVQPSSRDSFAMAYDARRKRTVLFGGHHSVAPSEDQLLADTWEWDGASWHAIDTATAPSSRHRHRMAYDPVRGVVVMCGGDTSNPLVTPTPNGECWAYDGVTWTQMTGTTPPARYDHAMAYDAVRGELVLAGGSTSPTSDLQDTWILRADGWHQGANLPQSVSQHAMAFDGTSRKLLAFGGKWNGTATGLTASWDGQAWAMEAGGNFGAYSFLVGATDGRGRAVRQGGTISGNPGHEMATWTGTSWSVVPDPVAPQARTLFAIAPLPLRGTTLVFGGVHSFSGAVFLNDTWELAGQGWIAHPIPGGSTPPAARHDTAMAYDALHDRVIMFGGAATAGTFFGDTWWWDGAQWNQLSPATSPSARSQHSMAYDSARNQIVLYGGGNDEMWTWDGTTWTQVPKAGAWPPIATAAAMSFDPIRSVIVLRVAQQTWLWNGSVWQQKQSSQEPPARVSAAMAWSPARRQTIMFGGGAVGASVELDDTWEFDGEQWHEIATPEVPPAVKGAGMASIGTGVYVYGGHSGALQIVTNEAFELVWQGAAPIEACGTGEDGDGDGKVGCADPDCWYACDPLCPPGAPCDAAALHCGDGACSSLESCRSCPGDCSACTAVCGDHACDPGETMQSCPGDCPM